MSNRATEDALASLHGALAEAMQEKLTSKDFTASDLNVIRAFLKDNGIDCDGETNPVMKSLADDLPDDLDNVTPLYGG